MALEKVDLGKKLVFKKDAETGEPLMDEPPEWTEEYEIRADGADVTALEGEMKDAAQVQLQQAYNRERKYGTATLSDPNGRPVTVLQNEVDRYEEKGYGKKALKLTFRVNGFGGMKRAGLKRCKYLYRAGQRITLMEE